jgi:UDP-N-acetylmuramate--alanine ligase
MKGVATDIGTIHFIGIGGIGMSGIAEIMHSMGYKVQGSDMAEGYVIQHLRDVGIKVMIGHKPENLGDAAVVVTSTAVKRSNPEVALALEQRIPVIRRPRWSPRSSTRAASTPPSSTAASSTATAPTPVSEPATGWWWRRTRATAASCASTAQLRS